MKKKIVNDPKKIRMQLAKLIANQKVPSKTVSTIAKSLASAPYEIRRIDICPYGFCCDFMINGNLGKALSGLADLKGARFRFAESFPWGIIDDSIRHLRTSYEFDGFNPGDSITNFR